MRSKQLLGSGAVALICAGILVLFTDIEVGVTHWFNCGPLSAPGEKHSHLCR